jgi:trk system potassium uptake protein TrkA
MPRFAVIGLGRFGATLSRELTAAGGEVIAIDSDRQLVEDIRDEVTLAIRLDSTDEEALRTQGVDKVDAAIVGIGEDFEAAALTTANLKAIGVPRVISRAVTQIRGEILSRIGADTVIYPERETAVRWAQRLMMPELRNYIELGEGHGLIELVAPPSFHQKTLEQLRLRQQHNLLLVAIRRSVAVKVSDYRGTADTQVVIIPHADTVILPSDVLIIIGSNEALAELPRA